VLAVEQNKVLIPPAYNKYLAWGFSDLSVRIGNYESEKVRGGAVGGNLFSFCLVMVTDISWIVFNIIIIGPKNNMCFR